MMKDKENNTSFPEETINQVDTHSKMDKESLSFLWKHYNDQINTIDGRLTVSVSIAFGAFTFASYITKDILSFLPLFSVVFLFYLSYQLRVIELLRGYLLYIENNLIAHTKETAFSWNTYGVMKNYNVKYFRSQRYSIPFYAVFLGGGSVFGAFMTVFKLLKTQEYNTLAMYSVFFIFCVFFAVLFVKDMKDNKFVADAIYAALKNSDIQNPPSIKKLLKLERDNIHLIERTKNMKTKKEASYFPDEFNYEKHFETYDNIGNTKYIKKNNAECCKNYNLWSEHIRLSLNQIGVSDSYKELKWALQKHMRQQKTLVDVLKSIGLSIVMFMLGYFVQFIIAYTNHLTESAWLNSMYYFIVPIIIGVSAEIIMISIIRKESRKKEFDEDVIQIIDEINSQTTLPSVD